MIQTLTLPFPNSWYCVAFSRELPPGKIVSRTLAGYELVTFRTKSGQACAMDAFCPHLGAHMGVGGTVVGEEIRCPFHHFRFDTAGTCVATGYGTKPLREINGLVFVYYDGRNLPPTWEPAALDEAGWTPLIYKVLDLHDHPQETVENAVDIGHFAMVHGYSEVALKRDFVVDGPFFHISYAARRPMPFLGRLGARVNFEFNVDIHGLGFSVVRANVPRYGIQSRLFVLATPTVEGRIKLGLALNMKHIGDPGRIHPLAKLVPHAFLDYFIARAIHDGLVHDVCQDLVIWENKRYVHPPALAEGDGPIGKYRLWARQFYHEQAWEDGRQTTGPIRDKGAVPVSAGG